MPGLLSKFRSPPVIETDAGPALPPVPVKDGRARPAPPVRFDDAALPALPPEPVAPVEDDLNVPALPPKQSLFARLSVKDDADDSATLRAETMRDAPLPALPPEPVAPVEDDLNVPALPPKQSLFARLSVKDDADDSATLRAETMRDAPHHGLPAVNTPKKGKRGRSEPQQAAIVHEQAADPQAGNPSAAQNIVVNVTTAAAVPYWGWVGCGSWSCPFRRGLVCRRWWCW